MLLPQQGMRAANSASLGTRIESSEEREIIREMAQGPTGAGTFGDIRAQPAPYLQGTAVGPRQGRDLGIVPGLMPP